MQCLTYNEPQPSRMVLYVHTEASFKVGLLLVSFNVIFFCSFGSCGCWESKGNRGRSDVFFIELEDG